VVDSGPVTVDDSGYVVADPDPSRARTGIRIFASVDGGRIQSDAQTIDVTFRPDSVRRSGKSQDTVRYAQSVPPLAPESPDLALTLLGDTGSAGVRKAAAVRSYVVAFAIDSFDLRLITDTTGRVVTGADTTYPVDSSKRIAATDTVAARLLSGRAGGRSRVDTTDATGTASARVRFSFAEPNPAPGAPLVRYFAGRVYVHATAWRARRGGGAEPVPGTDSLAWVVILRAKAPPKP
jgi:hypothetical protein